MLIKGNAQYQATELFQYSYRMCSSRYQIGKLSSLVETVVVIEREAYIAEDEDF